MKRETVLVQYGPGWAFTFDRHGESAGISSGVFVTEDDDHQRGMRDGVESMMLAMFCEGYEMDAPAMHRVMETVADAVDNNS